MAGTRNWTIVDFLMWQPHRQSRALPILTFASKRVRLLVWICLSEGDSWDESRDVERLLTAEWLFRQSFRQSFSTKSPTEEMCPPSECPSGQSSEFGEIR